MRNLIIVLAMMAAPVAASADQGFAVTRVFGSQLTAAAVNTTKTITLTLTDNGAVGGNAVYTKVKLQVDYTRSAGTAVVVTWRCSLDGTTFPTDTVRDASAKSVEAYSDTVTGTADFNLLFHWGVAGCRALEIDIIATTGNASDKVDAYAVAVVGE